jgi:hypothetical protein
MMMRELLGAPPYSHSSPLLPMASPPSLDHVSTRSLNKKVLLILVCRYELPRLFAGDSFIFLPCRGCFILAGFFLPRAAPHHITDGHTKIIYISTAAM